MITPATATPQDARIAELEDTVLELLGTTATLRAEIALGIAAAEKITRALVAEVREHERLKAEIVRIRHGQAVRTAMHEQLAGARTT